MSYTCDKHRVDTLLVSCPPGPSAAFWPRPPSSRAAPPHPSARPLDAESPTPNPPYSIHVLVGEYQPLSLPKFVEIQTRHKTYERDRRRRTEKPNVEIPNRLATPKALARTRRRLPHSKRAVDTVPTLLFLIVPLPPAMTILCHTCHSETQSLHPKARKP